MTNHTQEAGKALQDKVTALQNDIAARLGKRKALPAEVKTALNEVSKKNLYSTLVKLFEAQGFTNTAMFLTDPSTLKPVAPEPKAETTALIVNPITKTSYPARNMSAVETLFDLVQEGYDPYLRFEAAKYIVDRFGHEAASKQEAPKP